MTGWVILSRDGVINQHGAQAIPLADTWQPVPGSIEAIADLCKAGYKVAVATNQSAIGRGAVTLEQVHALHAAIEQAVLEAGGQLQGFYLCPHVAEQNCNCRKPRIGLLEQIEKDHNIRLKDAWCVGDSLRDIQAAKAIHSKAVLVRTGKGTRTETSILVWPKYGENTVIFDNLATFTKHLLDA